MAVVLINKLTYNIFWTIRNEASAKFDGHATQNSLMAKAKHTKAIFCAIDVLYG